MKQFEILSYYFTLKGEVIAWIKMDPLMVREIHQRAARASSKHFRTVTFVPPIARSRKTAIDKILMSYKKANPDFRYSIRNGTHDLQVMIKRLSEYQFTPYRPIEIEDLGEISPLKLKFTSNEDDETEELEDEEGFQKIARKLARPNFLPKDQIFYNIKAALDGFEKKKESNDNNVEI